MEYSFGDICYMRDEREQEDFLVALLEPNIPSKGYWRAKVLYRVHWTPNGTFIRMNERFPYDKYVVFNPNQFGNHKMIPEVLGVVLSPVEIARLRMEDFSKEVFQTWQADLREMK